jgi:putative DNA methylase
LNQQVRGLYRDENVFEDADIQMAGYAAALRVLTRYSIINGKDMVVESLRPRINGEKTFVDELIDFAVDHANGCLVPHDLEDEVWKDLSPGERFYLKLLDLEAKGIHTLDNYQNFAKAFKVKDFSSVMASEKANAARLKGAVEFGGRADGGELGGTSIRAVLYALAELVQEEDGEEVLAHLNMNIPDSFDPNRRRNLTKMVDYLAGRLESIRPEEAQAARILGELIRNQRLG